MTGDGSEVDEHGQESGDPPAAPGTEGHRGEGEEVDVVEGGIPQSAAEPAEDQSSQTHEVQQCTPHDTRRIFLWCRQL